MSAYTYLDIGAIRIQSYIGRSRALADRRGASAMLSQRMSLEADELVGLASEQTGQEFERNPEAAEVDGVLSLRGPEGVLSDNLRAAAAAITSRLRSALPAATFSVRSAEGQTYAAAFDRMIPLYEAFPPLGEYPPVRPCESCGQASATVNTEGRCEDCATRSRHAPRTTIGRGAEDDGKDIDVFASERDLLVQVNNALGRRLGVVRDFEELAELSGGRRDNHIATVLADGNGIGALFQAVHDAERRSADTGGHAPGALVRDLSHTVKEATRNALLAATLDVVVESDKLLPVVPHVLGGDDVMLSVPAKRVWRFIRSFLSSFLSAFDNNPRLKEAHAAAADGRSLPPVTMSAGVVICHESFPFGLQTDRAESLLKWAKRHGHGTQSTVAWVDVTADGEEPPPTRLPWSLEELEQHWSAISDLAAEPAAFRSALAGALRTQDAELARQRVRQLRPEPVAAVRPLLEITGEHSHEQLAAEVNRLHDVLSLARWWSQ